MKAVGGDHKSNVSLNFCHRIVMALLQFVKPEPDTNVEDVDEASYLFFTMSSLTCVYNESTRAVQSIDAKSITTGILL